MRKKSSTCACLGVYKLGLETYVRKNHNQRRRNSKGSQKIKIQLKSEKCGSLRRTTKTGVRVGELGRQRAISSLPTERKPFTAERESKDGSDTGSQLLMTWETEVTAQQISDTDAACVQKSIGWNTHRQEPLTLQEQENRRH